MRQPVAATQTVWEDSGGSMMARILGAAGTAITQASLSSIALTVFDMTTSPTSGTAATAPVVADTVFDTLQTDARWTRDGTGYNFRYTFLASQIATGGRRYRYEFLFTPSSGQAFHVVFDLDVAAIARS